MTSMIFFLFLIVAIVSYLLYQIVRNTNTSMLMTTILIIVSFIVVTGSSVLVYNSLGYARPINIFNEKWVLHHFVPDDKNQTFILVIQADGDAPRLISYKITSKEKYEKQKKGLTKAKEAATNGQFVEGSFDSDNEEFRFYEFSMKATSPKE